MTCTRRINFDAGARLFSPLFPSFFFLVFPSTSHLLHADTMFPFVHLYRRFQISFAAKILPRISRSRRSSRFKSSLVSLLQRRTSLLDFLCLSTCPLYIRLYREFFFLTNNGDIRRCLAEHTLYLYRNTSGLEPSFLILIYRDAAWEINAKESCLKIA